MGFELRETKIATDQNGFLNLNDIWKLSREKETKAPSQWVKLVTCKELAEALLIRGIPTNKALYAARGRYGGTYAHVILALAYAEYLNPALGVEVREIALRVYAGDVGVLDDYRRDKAAQIEEDESRITIREEIKRNNLDLNQRLKETGARHKAQYAAFHDHGYQGLYGGMRENDIHARKQLSHEQKILDHMNFGELSANMFRTATAQDYMRTHGVDGVKRACEIHKRFGEKVRDFLQENDLTLPEDQPVADSIKDAEKRLKNHQKALK